MKMQSNYKVTADCIVSNILVSEGDPVNANQVLIELEYWINYKSLNCKCKYDTEKKYTAGLKNWTNARRWAAAWTRSRNNTPQGR